MAQTFLELKSIARQALPRLIENLVMPNLCYKDYSDTYTNLGDTIQVKKPVVLTANDFTPGDTVTPDEIEESSVDVKLDKIATVDVNVGALQAVHNMDEAKFITDFIEPATVALAEKINGAGLDAWKQIPNVLGVAGTTPDGLDDFSAARKFLNKAKAPLGGRVAVWDPEADAAFTQIGNLVKVNESGSPRALREGEIGRVFGLDNYMAQGVKSHTPGATGTILVDGTGFNVGATQIHVDGLTTAFTVGDTFTIANDSTKYTVVKAGALSTADQDIDIIPALQKNAADNAAITVISAAVQNLVFHKNAIAFVTRPLHAPVGVDSYTTSFNGFSLRVTRGYDMATKTEKMAMDVLYNYKVVYPEIAARYLG